MRVDRFLSLYAVKPLLRLRLQNASIPILMYHSISEQDETGTSPYYRTCTAPKVFSAQMKFLSSRGFRSISLVDARGRLERGEDVSQSVVITFDDGFRDFHTEAFPVLKQSGHTATMFLPTAYIGDQRRAFKGRECLTWDEIRSLRNNSMHFGSHTVNHPKLVELSPQALRSELVESKTEIEQQLGENVETFAYPYAFPQENHEFSSAFQRVLKDVGYSICVTTRIGRIKQGDNCLTWKRLPVNSCDDSGLLEAKLVGAYDWLAGPQNVFKRLKSAVSH